MEVMDHADPLGAGSRRRQNRLDLVLAGDVVAENGRQQVVGDGVRARDGELQASRLFLFRRHGRRAGRVLRGLDVVVLRDLDA
jgi:hypothetical protein